MSIFAAVREQHPDWDDEAIYKDANIIYAEKAGTPIQMVDQSKPSAESAVLMDKPSDDEPADDKDKSADANAESEVEDNG